MLPPIAFAMPPNIDRLAFFSAVSWHCFVLCAFAGTLLRRATGATASSPDKTKARIITRTPVSISRLNYSLI
jgi:hypothetical protein